MSRYNLEGEKQMSVQIERGKIMFQRQLKMANKWSCCFYSSRRKGCHSEICDRKEAVCFARKDIKTEKDIVHSFTVMVGLKSITEFQGKKK